MGGEYLAKRPLDDTVSLISVTLQKKAEQEFALGSPGIFKHEPEFPWCSGLKPHGAFEVEPPVLKAWSCT